MARERPGKQATINSVVYNVDSWETQQQGRVLEEKWTDGWTGGMGEYIRRSRDRYYLADGADPSTYPMLRLRASNHYEEVAVTNLAPTTAPVFQFIAEDGGTPYLYILNGRRTFKILASDGSTVQTIDHGATAVCGHPAFFEGKWYLPLGDAVDYKRLDTIVSGSGDTFGTPAGGEKARHFAKLMKDGTAQLARAVSTNQISLSSDGVNWGSNAEVGDSSLGIVDLRSWLGELAVIKPDAVYRFDENDASFPVEEFVGSQLTPPYAYYGANSHVHGQYLYWPHISGLWRFFRGAGQPIGFEAARDWIEPAAGEGTFSTPVGWDSVAAYGQWLYATSNGNVFFGRIAADGTVLWHGRIWAASDSRSRIGITDDGGPQLWLYDAAKLTRLRIADDGSQRTNQVANRGDASKTYTLWLPRVDFGEPDKEKQLRRMWVHCRHWNSNCSLQLAVLRDGSGTPANVGSAITTDGVHEVAWTPGTNDLAYIVMPKIINTTNGDYSSGSLDPQILSFGIQAATATIYRVVVPLTVESIRSGQSISTAHQALRDLLNGPRVAIVEPTLGGAGDTFNGRIVGYTERAVGGAGREGAGWIVTLMVQRFDYGS